MKRRPSDLTFCAGLSGWETANVWGSSGKLVRHGPFHNGCFFHFSFSQHVLRFLFVAVFRFWVVWTFLAGVKAHLLLCILGSYLLQFICIGCNSPCPSPFSRHRFCRSEACVNRCLGWLMATAAEGIKSCSLAQWSAMRLMRCVDCGEYVGCI